MTVFEILRRDASARLDQAQRRLAVIDHLFHAVEHLRVLGAAPRIELREDNVFSLHLDMDDIAEVPGAGDGGRCAVTDPGSFTSVPFQRGRP